MHGGMTGPGGPPDHPKRHDEEIYEDSLPADLLPGHQDHRKEDRPWVREHREDNLRELMLRRLSTAFFIGLIGLFVLIFVSSPADLVKLWASALLSVATLLAIAIRYYYRRK